MKRILLTLLALVLFIALLACCNVVDPNPQESGTAPLPPINRISNTDMDVFPSYLDSVNMVHGHGQHSYVQYMESLTLYDGTPLADVVNRLYSDGTQGGGCSARGKTPDGKQVGFGDDWEATEDDQYADYEIWFYTETPLVGFALPFGLEFGDTLEGALDEIGIELDPYTAFIADYEEEQYAQMVLYREDGQCLALNRKTDGSFELLYTEAYPTTLGNGRAEDVTRHLKFSFADNESVQVFDALSITVSEHYKLH